MKNLQRMIHSLGRATGAGLLLLAAPAMAIAPATPAAAAPSADLDQAVKALRAISTMQADFTQVDRNGQRVTGVLTLKRPGKIRFQYQKGVPLLIVSDGNALTMIDYEVAQTQRWPIGNSPLGALLDPDRDVSRYGEVMPTNHPDVISVRVRDAARPEYGTMTMIFRRNPAAPGGLELSSWVTVDSQDTVTKVFLENQRYGMEVSENTFRFRDPTPRVRR